MAPADSRLGLGWSDGVLGSGIEYQLDGDAFEVSILIPSFTTGPTPLALFFPGELKVLGVGLDLSAFAVFAPLDAGGQSTVAFNLPADPALAGLTLRAQAFTLDVSGLGLLADALSSVVSTTLSLPGEFAPTAGQPILPRRGHSMARLADGRVLLAGGVLGDGVSGVVSTDTWEVYDPATELFTLGTSTLAQPRSGHTATALNDGRILLAGGAQTVGGGSATPTGSVELFDPVTEAFLVGPSLVDARIQHTATLLPDGRVFVVGGRSSPIAPAEPFGGSDQGSTMPATTELFDPLSNTWSLGPSLPSGRIGHSATLLSDGTVLIAGGRVPGMPIFGATPTVSTADVFIFDPLLGTVGPGTSLPIERAHHTAVTSGQGGVFLAGGLKTVLILTGIATIIDDTGLQVELYSTSTSTWNPLGLLFAPAVDIPESYCIDVGGGCFDYVIQGCPDPSVLGPDGMPLEGRTQQFEVCGMGPLFTKENLANPALQPGHRTIFFPELGRLLTVGADGSIGVPTSTAFAYTLED